MTVSVVVPAYNAIAHLGETVPAVLALDDVEEWIWVDDGSTDTTYEELSRRTSGNPRVRILRHEGNQGRAAARNTGIAAAAGEVIACLDADARPMAGYIHAHLRALAHPDAVASIGRIRPADPVPGDPYTTYLRIHPRGPKNADGPTSWGHLVTCAACIQADVLRRAGGFDPSVHYGEDADLACRFAALAPGGLHIASGAVVDLYGTETLPGALGKTRQFGASLRQIVATTPNALDILGLSRLHSRFARSALRSARLARLVQSLLPVVPPSLVATGVRYLLGHALYGGYSDVREGVSSNP